MFLPTKRQEQHEQQQQQQQQQRQQQQQQGWSFGRWGGWNLSSSKSNTSHYPMQTQNSDDDSNGNNDSDTYSRTTRPPSSKINQYMHIMDGPEMIRSMPPMPPKLNPTTQYTNKLLAQYMNNLSIDERNVALEELHGVNSIGGGGSIKGDGRSVVSRGEQEEGESCPTRGGDNDDVAGATRKLSSSSASKSSTQQLFQSSSISSLSPPLLLPPRPRLLLQPPQGQSQSQLPYPPDDYMLEEDAEEHYYIELANAIERVPNKHAYDAAYNMNREYVTNRKFLKLFLLVDK